MKLTKLQRHTAYIIMLVEAEEKIIKRNFSCGLCSIFWGLAEEYSFMIRNALTELDRKLRAINKRYDDWDIGFIFSQDKTGWQKRIELLKQCIEETV